MHHKHTPAILAYLEKVKTANKELTKKELFKDLLHRLYSNNAEIGAMIDDISAGAEHTVLNIPRQDGMHRGSADTLYNHIIIEFENDLKSNLAHAKQQLAGYMLGQFNSGEGYHFTLIASDFINWKVFVPDLSQLEILETLKEDELILNEAVLSSLTLTEENAEDFYYWIDRFLFKESKQRATLLRVEEAFGQSSTVFVECFRGIGKVLADAKKFGEVQVSYEQWRRFLSIAYGSFDDSDAAFAIHSYLSILAKMLAFQVLSNLHFIHDDQMEDILNGKAFHQYNLRNFVDNDFFHWVHSDRHFSPLKKVFRLLAQQIAKFDFTNTDEDVLKGVYLELIDLDTRHSLGEYYTPDWLCERVVKEFNFKPTDKILDPSCGSGSFLRAAVHRMREGNPQMSPQEISNCIYGIDIHPLSVQIAKTTLVLALGGDIGKANKPLKINIILANTLLAPEGVQNLFGGEFTLYIDKEKYYLNTLVLEDMQLFDTALDMCEDLANHSISQPPVPEKAFAANLKMAYPVGGFNGSVTQSFYKIYKGLKKVKEEGRDSIWKFILQNLYKPYFLRERFDYIVGNPPWFTYSSIKNVEYQNILAELASQYDIRPEKVANFPHLEIAAIFLGHCANYFLKDTGRLGFVLPRSFFSSDHHENTRSGKAKGFVLSEIWDLQGVSPLFNIPTCVLFANKSKNGGALPKEGLAGIGFNGRLPMHNSNLGAVGDILKEKGERWYYSQQGSASAFSKTKQKQKQKPNPYKPLFRQGATIVPRTFYFVDIYMATVPESIVDRILNIRTSEAVQPESKKPWKGIAQESFMESMFLFRTALSRNILPFHLYSPPLVVLPLRIDNNEGIKSIALLSLDELLELGSLKACRWFKNCENLWEINRTEKNRNTTATDYLNWQNKLTTQQLNVRYLVIYTASAKDANATVVDREKIDVEFFVESCAYVFFTQSEMEAYYLTSILNATKPNVMIKDFQAKGLFGPRHVAKKILDVYFPKFDPSNKQHIQLAELSKMCHIKAKQYVLENNPAQALSAMHLGRLRLAVKKHLQSEMAEIDLLVGVIVS